MSASGLPTGATATFTPNPATSTTTLQITTTAATPTGSYPLTITGTDGPLNHTTTITLTVTAAPDFSLSSSPTTRTVTQGGSASYALTITRTNGFADSVTMSAGGLPTGATATFSPNPATSTTTLQITTTATTPTGSYPLTITGADGALNHTITVTLVVNAAPDFSLSSSPTSQEVVQNGTAQYTITVNPVGGFASSVTLKATGLPSGTSANFTPGQATTTSTLKLKTAGNTPPGSYAITVTGTQGALSHSIVITLVVDPTPDFTLSATPTTLTIPSAGTAQYTISVTPVGSFTGAVTLKAGGLPGGATATFNPTPTSSTAVLSITVTSTRSSYSRTITITGTSGSLNHSVKVTLQVTGSP
jgi:uncharacterized membrane protein